VPKCDGIAKVVMALSYCTLSRIAGNQSVMFTDCSSLSQSPNASSIGMRQQCSADPLSQSSHTNCVVCRDALFDCFQWGGSGKYKEHFPLTEQRGCLPGPELLAAKNAGDPIALLPP